MSLTGWLQKLRRHLNQTRIHSRPAAGRRRRLLVESLEPRIVPSLAGNTLFPADNPWNQKITNAPVAANSATLVSSIGLGNSLHPDFGTVWNGSLNGIPVNLVPGAQPKINVVIDAYPSESDLQPVPIPANAVIEGDPAPSSQNTGDRHLLVYDQDHNILYETFNTHRPSEEPDHQWHADSEAVWDLNKDSFRTPGFTSADAAGLPILPGLVRPDEVLDQGKITHALRFTVPRTDNQYVFPASHVAGSNNASLPRMGERFRLKQSVDISGYSAADQVILQALKDYGMIVADNGSSWYLSGEPSSRWSDDDLHNLSQLHGRDFEAVDLTPVVSGLGQSSGPASGGETLTINGSNFSGGAGQTQVSFGTTAAMSVTVLSDTQIQVTVPPHGAGAVDVTVQSPYGTSAKKGADLFTYGGSTLPAGQLQLAASSYTVLATGGSATVTVTRTGGSTGAVTVQYATSDGTAKAGVDYTAASGALTFADGQTSRTISIPILKDPLPDGNEAFTLTLSNTGGGATLGSPGTAAVTVTGGSIPLRSDSQGTLTVVNTGSSQVVFAVGTDYAIYRHDPSGWAAVTGPWTARSVSATTENGHVVLFAVTGDYRLLRSDNLVSWGQILGPWSTLSITSATDNGHAEVYAITGDHQLLRDDSAGLVQYAGPWSTLSASPVTDGSGRAVVYVVTGDHRIVRRDWQSGWNQVANPWTTLSIATATESGHAVLFAVTWDHSLLRMDDGAGWIRVANPGTTDSTGAGTDASGHAVVYAITKDGQLLRLMYLSGWDQLAGPGSVTAIDAAPSTSGPPEVFALWGQLLQAFEDPSGWTLLL